MDKKEFIEREKAIDACFNGWNNNAHDCAENIRSIPAADVRPVKRGKWEEVEVSYIEDMYDKGNLPEAIVSMYCPICERYHNEVFWYGNPTDHVNYCPHCGNDMRGES